MSKYIIGAAAFGTRYGVANEGAISDRSYVERVISKADALGIRKFDTAPAYGDSEEIIGDYFDSRDDVQISTKIGKVGVESVEQILKSIDFSLYRLKTHSIWCVYLHDPQIYKNPNLSKYQEALRIALDSGKVQRVGISVYNELEAERNIEAISGIEVIQFPENICDRRLLNSDFTSKVISSGRKLILRSIFSQGLLLMNPSDLPSNLSKARPAIVKLNHIAESLGFTTAQLCLAYSHELKQTSGTIVGISRIEQLEDLTLKFGDLPKNWFDSIPTLPDNLRDPRKW
jgi:aryl-alcohol dehydrogenase-like predicted oxidoreductase